MSEDKARILVVYDDKEHANRLVGHLLAGAGYEAVLAGGDRKPPPVDLVLVDVDRVLVSPLA